MRVFTVHGAPPGREMPMRLLPEGFSVWGFIGGPLWLLRHGAWPFAIAATLLLATLPWAAWPAVAVLTGLCGHDARRAMLAWRGWPVCGLVVGADWEDAALRWLRNGADRAPGTLP